MSFSIPWMTLAIVALLAVAAWGVGMVGAAWWSAQNAPQLGLAEAGRLQACPDTPNCVSSQAIDASSEQRIAPLPAGSGSMDEQRARMLGAIEAAFGERAQAYETAGFDADGYGRWEVRTPTLGFVDDLELLHDPEAGVFHVRSASRVGAGDGGTNRKRVERLTAAVQAELEGGATR